MSAELGLSAALLLPEPGGAAFLDAYQKGAGTIHDIRSVSPDAARFVADQYGIFTTDPAIPRPNKSYGEFRRDQERQRMLATVAIRGALALQDVDGFAENTPQSPTAVEDSVQSGNFGGKISAILDGVRGLRLHGIHDEGVITVGKTEFIIPGTLKERTGKAEALAHVLRGLLSTDDGRYRLIEINHDDGDRGFSNVHMQGLTEFDVRAGLERVVMAARAFTFRALGVELPPAKMPFRQLLTQGETFVPSLAGLPDVKAMLAADAAAYQQLRDHSTIRFSNESTPLRMYKDTIAGSHPVFDILRGAIRSAALAEGRTPNDNLPQHPDKERRHIHSRGLEFRRDPNITGQERLGPPSSRGATPTEKIRDTAHSQFEEAMAHKLRIGLKLAMQAAKGVLGGVQDLILLPIERLPEGLRWGNQLRQSAQDYRHYRQTVKARRQQISTIARAHDPALARPASRFRRIIASAGRRTR